MPDNAVALAEIKTNYAKRFNFRVNTYLEAEILKGLTFKTELSADYNLNKTKTYQPDYTFGVRVSSQRDSKVSCFCRQRIGEGSISGAPLFLCVFH
jgi:hypothetical protein